MLHGCKKALGAPMRPWVLPEGCKQILTAAARKTRRSKLDSSKQFEPKSHADNKKRALGSSESWFSFLSRQTRWLLQVYVYLDASVLCLFYISTEQCWRIWWPTKIQPSPIPIFGSNFDRPKPTRFDKTGPGRFCRFLTKSAGFHRFFWTPLQSISKIS